MGQEIDHVVFTPAEHAEFARRLTRETADLIDRFSNAQTRDETFLIGLELETCLIDAQSYAPKMCNQAFLAGMDSPLASAELALHNVEFNTDPLPVQGDVLSVLHRNLSALLGRGRDIAGSLDAHLLMCGILPTIEPDALTLKNISPLNRYLALNRQVVAAHKGGSFRLDIAGREHLVRDLDSVMTESAATSFQIHLRTPRDLIRRAYNAALLASAPLVGVCANSPLLFGHSLWDETRIPVFEQAVGLGGFGAAGRGPLHRVSFGSGYARRSILECFEENHEHFPVLLPILDDTNRPLAHLRLHNGTIWRWNRPIVGFDDDGELHIRIEHRTLPAGPSLIDMIANTALFLGLVRHLMDCPVETLDFAHVRSNFYEAARLGLSARIDWLDGQRHAIPRLALNTLIPAAASGLALLGVATQDADHYLSVLEARLKSGQNGAEWQRRFLSQRRGGLAQLTRAMLDHQQQDVPIHIWE